MNSTAAGAQPLRYFIHDDFDAFRMEISGSLVGPAAQKAFEDWQTARFLARRARRVVDISYVTEADEDGKAVLRAWQEQKAQIVASTPASRAIANSIAHACSSALSPPDARWSSGFLFQPGNCRKSGTRRERKHSIGRPETGER